MGFFRSSGRVADRRHVEHWLRFAIFIIRLIAERLSRIRRGGFGKPLDEDGDRCGDLLAAASRLAPLKQRISTAERTVERRLVAREGPIISLVEWLKRRE